MSEYVNSSIIDSAKRRVKNVTIQINKGGLCEKGLNIIVNSIVGSCHAEFFYYGIEHLLVNAFAYIKESIKHNSCVYLYMQPELYVQIERNLSDREKANFNCLPPIAFSLSQGNEMVLMKKVFENCKDDAIQKGYSRATIILQSSFLFKTLERRVILEIEKYISDMASNLDISVLCAYDFGEFLNDESTDSFMRDINITHYYKLYQYGLIKSV